MAQEPIWPGSGSAVSESTPFALYDNDTEFQSEAPQVATWCARRLGYPIVDIELQDSQFYACLEESISEYSAQVNQFNIRDNLLHLKGQATSSNFTHKRVKSTLSENIFIFIVLKRYTPVVIIFFWNLIITDINTVFEYF